MTKRKNTFFNRAAIVAATSVAGLFALTVAPANAYDRSASIKAVSYPSALAVRVMVKL